MKKTIALVSVMSLAPVAFAQQATPAKQPAQAAPQAQAKTAQPAAPASADSKQTVVIQNTPDISTLKFVLATERRRVFEKAMNLSAFEKDPFWNIYAQWEKEGAANDEAAIKLLAGYAKDYATITDEQALKMVKASASNQQKVIALRSKYTNLLSKSVSGKVAARFYQVADYINTAVRLDALDNIPLIGMPAQAQQAQPSKK